MVVGVDVDLMLMEERKLEVRRSLLLRKIMPRGGKVRQKKFTEDRILVRIQDGMFFFFFFVHSLGVFPGLGKDRDE